MAALPDSTLSPAVLDYLTTAPDGVRPFLVGNVATRLILQEGTQFSKDDFNMDVANVPYKAFVGSDWKLQLPARGDTLAGFSGMQVWDPARSVTIGRMWVDFRMQLRGLLVSGGVSTVWNSFDNNPKPLESVGIGTAQISGTDGVATLDVTFSRPQTIYRYVTTNSDPTPPASISNTSSRPAVILSYAVRLGEPTPPVEGTSGAPTITGFNLDLRERCIAINTAQVGAYYQHEAVVVKEYYDTVGG